MKAQEDHDDGTRVTYLGDGLYAENDGFMLRLYTQSGDNVYLEPEVYAKLVTWMDAR